jgi:hypothetical protein
VRETALKISKNHFLSVKYLKAVSISTWGNVFLKKKKKKKKQVGGPNKH